MLLLESSYYAFGFYAALNALIMLVLSMRVVRARFKTNTAYGDGAKPEMAAPLRAHANNAEYVPVALILLWAIASPLGRSIWLIHGMGVTLTIGRILHAMMGYNEQPSELQVIVYVAILVAIVAVFSTPCRRCHCRLSQAS